MGPIGRLRGWGDEELQVVVDHVQGDPFAAPSRVRVCSSARVHGIPEELRASAVRRMAVADFLLRRFAGEVAGGTDRSGSGKSGVVVVDAGDAEILVRSGCGFVGDGLELRFRAGLPAQGRRVMGRAAARLLTEDLPRAARAVQWSRLDGERVRQWVELVEDHEHLQGQLAGRGLVAFVRDGAVLPRASGVSSAPLRGRWSFAARRRCG